MATNNTTEQSLTKKKYGIWQPLLPDKELDLLIILPN